MRIIERFLTMAVVVLLPGLAAWGQIEPLAGPWYTGSKNGTPALSDSQANTFDWGSDTTPSATAQTGLLWSYFPDRSLDVDGSSITVRFTVTSLDASASKETFRFGLYNNGGNLLQQNLNGVNTNNAFLTTMGYFVSWNVSGGGSLYRRVSGNANPCSTTGTASLGSGGGGPILIQDESYEMALTITRLSSSLYEITSIVDVDGPVQVKTTTDYINATSFNSFFLLHPSTGIDSLALRDLHLEYEATPLAQPASLPIPTDETDGIGALTTLSWAAPIHARTSQVYLGDTYEAVLTGTPDSSCYLGPTATRCENDPGRFCLEIEQPEAGRRWYWRVDLFYDGGLIETGPVWSFTTADYRVIDDFDYELNDSSLIAYWQDGSSNGSTSQISPYLAFHLNVGFDNSQPPYFAEVTLPFDSPQDWSKRQADLSFWYRGDPAANALHISLSDSQATHTLSIDDPTTTQCRSWQLIRLRLIDFSGIDLAQVTRLSFKIGSTSGNAPGGQGSVGFDEIRLVPAEIKNYQQLDLNGNGRIGSDDLVLLTDSWLAESVLVNAASPSDSNLLAFFNFDIPDGASITDSSGQGHHAIVKPEGFNLEGQWRNNGTAGGGCLEFDGRFWLEIPAATFDSVTDQLTIAFWYWVDPEGWPGGILPLEIIHGTQRLNWSPSQSAGVNGWYHYALVIDNPAGIMALYHQGILVDLIHDEPASLVDLHQTASLIGIGADGRSGLFLGRLDDWRIYRTALTPAQIVWLATGIAGHILQPPSPGQLRIEPWPDDRIDLKDLAAIAKGWLGEY